MSSLVSRPLLPHPWRRSAGGSSLCDDSTRSMQSCRCPMPAANIHIKKNSQLHTQIILDKWSHSTACQVILVRTWDLDVCKVHLLHKNTHKHLHWWQWKYESTSTWYNQTKQIWTESKDGTLSHRSNLALTELPRHSHWHRIIWAQTN